MIKVNGHEFPWGEGLTVTKLLTKKGFTYQGIVVLVNGVSIKEEEFESTLIMGNDDVRVIHLIMGG